MCNSEVTDLFHLTDNLISVIGGGDAALDYSLSLAGRNRVRLWCRRLSFKSPVDLVSEVQAHSRIAVFHGYSILQIKRIESDNVQIKGRKPDGETFTDFCDDVVMALGREAHFDFIPGILLKRRAELEKEGVLFFIGDVGHSNKRQIALAVADGIRAAMTVASLERSNNR